MIGIVGAGLTGLALAHELARRGIGHVVFEAEDRPGGVSGRGLAGEQLGRGAVDVGSVREAELGELRDEAGEERREIGRLEAERRDSLCIESRHAELAERAGERRGEARPIGDLAEPGESSRAEMRGARGDRSG